MTWGEQNTETDAFAQIDMAKAAGINFIDTAEMYPVPPRPETYATTEQYIGNYFNSRGDRADWILATKIAGPGNGISHIRNGRPRFNREHIRTALDDSLRRLQTDWIDLYQLHWPERSTNFFGRLGYQHLPDDDFTPLEETLAALDDEVRAGRIRHIGISNETPWGAMKYLQLAETHKWPRAVSIQNPYNLLNRSFEVGLAEISMREQCGLLAYSPLAFGMLSGKYATFTIPALRTLQQPTGTSRLFPLCRPSPPAWPGARADGPCLRNIPALRHQQYHRCHDTAAARIQYRQP
jgi:aryl-alcohol dehydrogenase-like predicted oxidoreductase